MHLTYQHGFLVEANQRAQLSRNEDAATGVQLQLYRLTEKTALEVTHGLVRVTQVGHRLGDFFPARLRIERQTVVPGVLRQHDTTCAGSQIGRASCRERV